MKHSKNTSESCSKISHWYDEHRARDLFEKNWLDKAIEQLKPSASILDCGCGMGEPIGKYFIQKGFKLTGIDGCKELIAIAQQRVPEGMFLVKDMRDLVFNSKFDLIIAWNSFFHLKPDEQKKMFQTFSNHLNHEGLLLFTTGPEAGEIWSDNGGESLYHASLNPEEYKALLIKHGFELLDHKINDTDCHNHTIWLARYKTS